MTHHLFTIGYQGLSLEELLQILKEHEVSVVVDVRERTQSRKPGFSKTPLSEALEDADIEYESWRMLGTPAWIRKQHHDNPDWSGFADAYNDYLAGQGEALDDLEKKVMTRRTCLFCYEADPADCHRSILAKRLIERVGEENLDVTHLRAEPEQAD